MLKPFEKRISVSYSPLGPLGINPVNFLSQTFWGLISLVQVLRVGVSGVGHKLTVPPGETLNYDIPPPFVGYHAGVHVLARLHLCLSYLSQCGLFILCYGVAVKLVFRSFSKNPCAMCSCGFGVSIGRGEFRVFLCHYVELHFPVIAC